MKVCFKCGAMKPLSDFYPHSKMADGHLNKCKNCTKADVSVHYSEHREDRSNYEKRRFKRPDRKAQILEAQRNRRRKNPEKMRAYIKVYRAIKSGNLVRQPCKHCGEEKVQAHHHDYSKPLDVEWLCFKCHREHAHGQVVIANS